MRKRNSLILIGKRIKKIRIEKRISQEELAFMANINAKYMGDIERGEHNMSALVLIRLAKSLQTEVGELFPPLKEI